MSDGPNRRAVISLCPEWDMCGSFRRHTVYCFLIRICLGDPFLMLHFLKYWNLLYKKIFLCSTVKICKAVTAKGENKCYPVNEAGIFLSLDSVVKSWLVAQTEIPLKGLLSELC